MISAASAADPTPAPILIAEVVPLVPAWAVDKTFDYIVPDDLAARVSIGSLIRVPFGGRKIRGVITGLRRAETGRELAPIASATLPVPVAPVPMPDLYGWVARRYAAPRGRVFERAVPPRVRVAKVEVVPLRSPNENDGPALLPSYEGGSELLEALAHGEEGTWCFRASPDHDRGALIGEMLSAAAAAGDGAALVAVPEVHYGSRTLERIQESFPYLARVDSSASDMDRAKAWMRLAHGHGLGGGGRGVVFAPSPDLRLIVVDEEHDSVYKEDRSPRYDARRVAVERARLQRAVCVLVSGTPSVESGAAASSGAFRSVKPNRETLRSQRPIVEVVAADEDDGLSPELHARMRETLRRGESVGLLVPARGYARTLWCSVCRRSIRCDRCEAGMTFELKGRRLGCRRCGASEAPPDRCPWCGASEFRYLGRGAERYAEQLRKAFPRVPLVHMDRDLADQTSGTGIDWSGTGIYVTTWFGAKPELRAPVSLVGVVSADVLTRRVDFRAAEQAHQVLSEMARWAGPSSGGGRLIVQTADPNHHAIQGVVRGDYDFFLRRELELRRELSYPPFTELIKASATGPAAARLISEAAALARGLEARVLGPIEAPFPGGRKGARERVAGIQLLLKCVDALPVAEGLRDILPRVPRGSRLRVDVDPR